MPFPNFHSARINDPGKYKSFAYKNIAPGIDIVLGIAEGKSETQAYRFAKEKFTETEAKQWMEEHKIKYIKFEPAVEKNDSLRVYRYDNSLLGKVDVMPQGFVHVPKINPTRAGIFIYKNNNGQEFRELRLPDEVFKQDSMKTLAHIPLTNNHPPELLNLDNVKMYAVGWTGDGVNKDGELLETNATIIDKDAINDINNGKQELSCGYECDLEEVPGVWKGQQYDAIQRNIIYNHLAIVHKGRAGSQARLRLDTKDGIMVNDNIFEKGENIKMAKINLAGKDFEAPEELCAAIESEMGKKDDDAKKKDDDYKKNCVDIKTALGLSDDDDMDAIKKAIDDLKKDDDDVKPTEQELAATLEKSKAKNDALESELKNLKGSVDLKVNERISLIDTARKIFPEVKMDVSNVDIMKQVILKHSPEAAATIEKSDANYIRARFDTIVEFAGKVDGVANLGKNINQSRKDGGNEDETDPAVVREKRMKSDSEAWKQPLSFNKK